MSGPSSRWALVSVHSAHPAAHPHPACPATPPSPPRHPHPHLSLPPPSITRFGHARCAAWALAEAVATRLVPLWVNARGSDFSWEWTLMALEANVQLVGAQHSIPQANDPPAACWGPLCAVRCSCWGGGGS
jgi:hypothetical protein